MLQTIKDYARLTGLFIGATILFVRLLFGFKLPEQHVEPEQEPEPIPQPKHQDEKVTVDPMIMSVKDQIVNGQHTAGDFDFQAVKESMLRGAQYTRDALITVFPTMQRVTVPLWKFTHGRRISVLITVDFQTTNEGVTPFLTQEQEERLRHFGRASTCFLN